MSEDEVVNLMKSAKSEEDWNKKGDEVKKKCNGYPIFWFGSIVMSGLMAQVASTWK